jgi:E3 ubiquitin-protein ligase UBR2
LFYHFLLGVPGPSMLMEAGGDTFENLCAYLGLPNSCHELVSSAAAFNVSEMGTA